MRLPFLRLAIALSALLTAAGAHAVAQDDGDAYFDAIEHPAIAYSTATPTDPVAMLARQMQDGTTTLAWDALTGYLPSLLRALDIPVASQLAVYSKTSLQQLIISPQNPRAIYFNDTVFVAWPRGGFIEIASEDPRQGVLFYMLPQQPGAGILRRRDCLVCHHSYNTLGVPGLLERSVATGSRGEAMPFIANSIVDDRTPFADRWAGWYVTGSTGPVKHLGNQTPPATRDLTATLTPARTTAAAFSEALDGYLSKGSDIAAHLVFGHQTRVINLITRLGWQVRVAEADHGDVRAVADRAARQLVDALLLVDEARLPGPVSGDPAFVQAFSARGPMDSRGRSLHMLDLHTRLLRYPCSYMIYTSAFDALPPLARDAVYQRMWTILSGKEKDARYGRLSAADRTAIVEILRETKKDLPATFAALN